MAKTIRLHRIGGYNRHIHARHRGRKLEQTVDTGTQAKPRDILSGTDPASKESTTVLTFEQHSRSLKKSPLLSPVDIKVKENRIIIPVRDVVARVPISTVSPPVIKGYTTQKLIFPIKAIQMLEGSPRISPRTVSPPQGTVLPKMSTMPLVTPRQYQCSPPMVTAQPTIIPDQRCLPILKSRKISTHTTPSLGQSNPSTSHPEDDVELPPIDADIFDTIFQQGGQGRIDDGKPTLICVSEKQGDGVFGLIETFCQHIYREKHGGLPESLKITDLGELEKEMLFIEASRKILSIKLEEGKWEELISKDENWARFQNRIDQLYSQGLGFIIINYPLLRAPSGHNIKIINVTPKILDIGFKRNFAEMVWGFVHIDDTLVTWEESFDAGRMRYDKALGDVLNEKRNKWLMATNHNEGDESGEHFLIKCFIVKILTEECIRKGKLKKDCNFLEIKDIVLTESKEETGRIRPDVIIKDSSEAYEIETLFSSENQGPRVIKKIEGKIKGYENEPTISTINTVLENLTLLRHLHEIGSLLEHYKSWEGRHKKRIQVWTLNIGEGRLVSFQEFQRSLRELMKTYNNSVHGINSLPHYGT